MEYIYDIRPYSCYDNWTVGSDTENVSSVLDKLLRITTKVTEQFASDILYDIRDFCTKLEEHEPYDRILIFRESGVSTYVVEDNAVKYPSFLSGIQVWRLTFDPDKTSTILTRVYLRGMHDVVGM